MNPALLFPWIAETVLITYRGAAQGNSAGNPIPHLPLPSDYVGEFIVFGALSLIPGPNGGRVASLFGWGLVVATFLNLYDPTTIGRPGGAVVKGSAKSSKPTATASQAAAR